MSILDKVDKRIIPVLKWLKNPESVSKAERHENARSTVHAYNAYTVADEAVDEYFRLTGIKRDEVEAELFKEEEVEVKHKFVRSACENTAENQKALFALGYTWFGGCTTVKLLNRCLYTNPDGLLSCSAYADTAPELYDFTTTTVATLKPTESESDKHIRELGEQIAELTKKHQELIDSKGSK